MVGELPTLNPPHLLGLLQPSTISKDPRSNLGVKWSPLRGPINPRPVHGSIARPHPGRGSRCTSPNYCKQCHFTDPVGLHGIGHPPTPTAADETWKTANMLNKPEPWNRDRDRPEPEPPQPYHDHDYDHDAMMVATLCDRTNHTANGHFSGRIGASIPSSTLIRLP